MYVLLVCCGLGLGKQLFEVMEVYVCSCGGYKVKLEVGIVQVEVLEFYECVGYCCCLLFGEYYVNLCSVCMEKVFV